MKAKVIKVNSHCIEFDNGYFIYSEHETQCCEGHWLEFGSDMIDDFKGLEFDLSSDKFFKRVEGYGIRLKPLSGHEIPIAGYGDNNGYYSDELTLIVECEGKVINRYDITDCQNINDLF